MVHGQYINIQVHTHAKADVVYALSRDGASWPTWTSIDSFELERAGLPVRDYRADVDLEPNAEGTRIRWHVSFSPKVPGTGWLLRWGITRFVTQCARGLAAYAPTATVDEP